MIILQLLEKIQVRATLIFLTVFIVQNHLIQVTQLVIEL